MPSHWPLLIFLSSGANPEMFGQGEFDHNTRSQGMGVLLQAVATTGAPTGSQNDAQEAVSVTVLHNAAQTIAPTDPHDASHSSAILGWS